MKKISYLILFIITISSQSCFEIVEEIVLNDRGSGNYELILNLSKSKTKLSSIEKMKTINGRKVPKRNEINDKIKSSEIIIKKTPGISNVKTTMDFENYILTFNCSFEKVENLNNVVKVIAETENPKKKYNESHFAYDIATKTFTRFNKIAVKNNYQKLSSADKEIFTTANYTCISRFDNNVISTSNADAKVSASKKAILLKQNVLDIILNKKTIENKIKLN